MKILKFEPEEKLDLRFKNIFLKNNFDVKFDSKSNGDNPEVQKPDLDPPPFQILNDPC
jgi:hypothetical protein